MEIVVKKSGKPFKSGKKIASIKGIIDHPYRPTGSKAYTFYDDDSCVSVEQVKFIKFDIISDIISFKLAKLAHSKGFQLFYDASMAEYNRRGSDLKGRIVDMPQRLGLIDNYFEAPTQELLKKWLVNYHNINISVTYNEIGCECNIYTSKGDYIDTLHNEKSFTWETYEGALEDGLEYALNLIK